jgi:hypothetical protein
MAIIVRPAITADDLKFDVFDCFQGFRCRAGPDR